MPCGMGWYLYKVQRMRWSVWTARKVYVCDIVIKRHFFQCRAHNSDAQKKLRVYRPARPLFDQVQKQATIDKNNTVQFTYNRKRMQQSVGLIIEDGLYIGVEHLLSVTGNRRETYSVLNLLTIIFATETRHYYVAIYRLTLRGSVNN
jgi:hypothetical protein